MAQPSLAGAPDRIRQEIARHMKGRDEARAALEQLAKRARGQAKTATRQMKRLQPRLTKWVDKGLPPDDKHERLARTYVEAATKLQDGRAAEAHALQTLERDAEEYDPAGGTA